MSHIPSNNLNFKKLCMILNNINPDILLYNGPNLVESGLLDSLSVMKIVSDIESEFGIEFDPIDIDPEIFSSVNSIYSKINDYLSTK